MVLPPALTARHITLLIPHNLQMLNYINHWQSECNLHLTLEDCKDTFWLMQRTDPFCKCIYKWLLSGKAPLHEVDTFIHIKGLLYKHVMDLNKKFLALVIPKSWHFMVLVKAHDKLGHQGVNRTYHLIKCQYYWKGMNKDICKYINNCALCKREKARTQVYPLQMTDIPRQTFWQDSHRPGLRSQHLCIEGINILLSLII